DFGALGTPIIGLQTVTGLDLRQLSAMVGRQLPFFSIIVPFWLVWAFAGFAGMCEIWPALLIAGVCFAVPQFLISNFHGPWLVDIVAAVASMGALILFLLKWHPHRIWGLEGHGGVDRGNGRNLLGDGQDRPLFPAHRGGHAGPGLRHPLFGVGRHDGSGLRPDRRAVSIFRDFTWLAGCRFNRIGYLLQCPLR